MARAGAVQSRKRLHVVQATPGNVCGTEGCEELLLAEI